MVWKIWKRITASQDERAGCDWTIEVNYVICEFGGVGGPICVTVIVGRGCDQRNPKLALRSLNQTMSAALGLERIDP
jgi:hypothetical protein